MTEAEWLACTDPKPMLEFLKGKVSDRKAKLFAAAAFRLVHRLLPDDRQRRAIELLDQLAEGTATSRMINRRGCEARSAMWARSVDTATSGDDPHFVGLMLYRAIVSSSRLRPEVLSGRLVNGAASHAAHASDGLVDSAKRREAQSALVREILGNPFRPATDPSPSLMPAMRLAATIYNDRAFGRMPELADALEAAACTNGEVIGHCRNQGPHVRGCWVLDLILENQ